MPFIQKNNKYIKDSLKMIHNYHRLMRKNNLFFVVIGKKRLLRTVVLAMTLLFTFETVSVYAQNIQKTIAFEWKNQPFIVEEKEHIYFYGATYQEDFGSLPLYNELFTENVARKIGTVTITNAIFIPMVLEYLITEEEKTLIPDTLYYTVQHFSELRRSNLAVTLLPFRKNSETGKIERLYCADISVDFSNSDAHRGNDSLFQFPTKSSLAEGDCFKIRVDKTGVFRVTGKDLKNMGMDIASVNPKHLKVFGMTGGVLPEMNTAIPNIGTREMAIYVSGQNNSAMSETDYILFYGESAHSWTYDMSINRFKHTFNYYDDYNYYFITAAGGEGKRIQTINNNHLTENATTTQSDYYMFHEQDLVNIIKAGRNWVGENFNSYTKERTFTVNIPNANTNEPFLLRTGLLTLYSKSSAKYSFSINGAEILKSEFTNGGDNPKYSIENKSFTAPSGNFSLKISFTPGGGNVEGWLDFFEIQARRNLTFNGGQISFRDAKTLAPETITKFTLQNATSQTTIWDVTDFYNVTKMTTENNGQSFKAKTDILREFIAFDNTYETPTFIGKIDNQNLQGKRNIESVIVAHPNFFEEAKKIEDEHSNNLGLKTILVTTYQIYNEYSSGRQDVSAIRDFMRMLYMTAETHPLQYLLLIGDASWDQKNTLKQSNFVHTWSSMLLSSESSVYHKNGNNLVGDDFFTLLDEKEGGSTIMCTGLPDIAVGRFPVNNAAEMKSAVKKRLHYTSGAPETMGTWRNVITFISDDPDSTDNPDNTKDYFSHSCEEHERVIMPLFPEAIIEKIYADSFKKVSSPGGTRYPDANKALTTRINQGTLILNYVGHGSKVRWSSEALFDIADINQWKNFNFMPFVVTETCSNGPFDDYELTTHGESMFLRNEGGAIGLLVSTRETSNGLNNDLTNALYTAMLPSADNIFIAKTIGKATMEAKRKRNLDNNSQKYILLGDPALTLSFPKYTIACTEINGKDAATTIDTISALSIVSFKGEVRNLNGSLKSDFNGMVYPTVFDKAVTTQTLGQVHPNSIFQYKLWKSIIFKGAAQVENGKFSFEFFVPKDIDYEYDFSKVSFYASDNTKKTDANGVFSNFVVGGLNPNAPIDTIPPQIRLFMNDTLFISGGYTNENPVLLAILYDENGINATGSSIGHNITAILDNDVHNEMNLNNFYQTEANSFKRGKVAFPLYGLEEGEHTITVRAWDSYNNSIKGSIKFVVVNSDKFVVRNLFNYPNPFKTTTNFVFEHNASDETLDINIRIFDLTGRLVREIRQTILATGYRIPPIQWNGDSGSGAAVASGYYIYQLTVKTSNGDTIRKSGKLVISR